MFEDQRTRHTVETGPFAATVLSDQPLEEVQQVLELLAAFLRATQRQLNSGASEPAAVDRTAAARVGSWLPQEWEVSTFDDGTVLVAPEDRADERLWVELDEAIDQRGRSVAPATARALTRFLTSLTAIAREDREVRGV